MTYQSEFEFAAQTDTGLVRQHNEDALIVCAAQACAVLADGMGGYNAGEVASAMTVETIARHLCGKIDNAWLPAFSLRPHKLSRWINEAIELANRKVLQAAQAEAGYAGMGTTVVVACGVQDKLLLAHVGDSRAYRFREHELTRLTLDHSVLQEQLSAGLISEQDARHSSIKNLITRAVGTQEQLEIELHVHPVQAGDIFLLCSDGLTDMLSHDEIQTILRLEGSDLAACCQQLVSSANNYGGMDNISVILFRLMPR